MVEIFPFLLFFPHFVIAIRLKGRRENIFSVHFSFLLLWSLLLWEDLFFFLLYIPSSPTSRGSTFYVPLFFLHHRLCCEAHNFRNRRSIFFSPLPSFHKPTLCPSSLIPSTFIHFLYKPMSSQRLQSFQSEIPNFQKIIPPQASHLGNLFNGQSVPCSLVFNPSFSYPLPSVVQLLLSTCYITWITASVTTQPSSLKKYLLLYRSIQSALKSPGSLRH